MNESKSQPEVRNGSTNGPGITAVGITAVFNVMDPKTVTMYISLSFGFGRRQFTEDLSFFSSIWKLNNKLLV